MTVRPEAVVGCLLGTAVGDALGLPYEQISRRRLHRLYANLDRYYFCFGRGMVSDDTEHACLTAQALIRSAGEVNAFRRDLGRRLRWWFLGLPAGVGKATARACLKLWLGFPPTRSGVRSAGNGPAMRSPLLGVCFGHSPDRLRDLVVASTRITHTDPKAEAGALAVALAASLAADHRTAAAGLADAFQSAGQAHLSHAAPELFDLLEQARASASAGESTEAFADSLGLQRGVSGYMLHTVPVAIHAWLAHPEDFRAALLAAIRCGGDTDTLAAIVGGIVGARVGRAGIPQDWLAGLWEWPRSPAWITRLGERLAEVCAATEPRTPLPLPLWGVPLRNLVFLLVVLVHGFRRLLPPY